MGPTQPSLLLMAPFLPSLVGFSNTLAFESGLGEKIGIPPNPLLKMAPSLLLPVSLSHFPFLIPFQSFRIVPHSLTHVSFRCSSCFDSFLFAVLGIHEVLTGQRERKRGWRQILTDNANTICTQHRWCPKL